MTQIDTDWIFGGIAIRKWANQRMVSITDIWKAAGCPAPMRPDKWFKSALIQEKLESLASLVAEGVERDPNGKLIKVPGVLEVVKGGRYTQGTFVSYDFAINYTQLLSNDINEWFIGVLSGNSENEPEVEENARMPIPVDLYDFNGKVRLTPDGRISVYDAIAYLTGHKNSRDAWAELSERFPEVVGKTDNFQFPGQGQRLTPVATLEVFLEILVLLPGKLAASVRAEAVRTLVRAMNGDLTLVEEIIARINNPEDLRDLEESIKVRRAKAYGIGVIPSGTLSNPLVEITPEVRKGYGWSKKLTEMESLLVELATHVGDMVIERKSPHRSYDSGTKAKSREIPLSLRTLKNLETLHIYTFKDNYVDDSDVADIFLAKAYPEVAYRNFVEKGGKKVVAHLVSPAGITLAGSQRLQEIQKNLDEKFQGKIILDSMRLDELVWGEMYPAIEERYSDSSGKFGWHQLNRKIKKICKQLCEQIDSSKTLPASKTEYKQLSLFGELLLINK